MKSLIKKIIPQPMVSLYHRVLAHVAAAVFRYPSKKMIVVGVTGTKGKSTTSFITAKLLEGAGYTVGLTSTAIFKIGKKEWLNDTKMTMLGRFRLQKLLRDMVTAGCDVAVIETSSEGIMQHRHKGIHYDMGVFTNLTPEHIRAHGSFEKYKAAKLSFFTHVERSAVKKINGHKIAKMISVNLDSEHASSFLRFNIENRYGWTLGQNARDGLRHIFHVHDVALHADGSDFRIDNVAMSLPLIGAFNISNAAAAYTVAHHLGAQDAKLREAMARLPQIPGRMEIVSEHEGFTVLVDYAHEPKSTRQLYEAVKTLSPHRIIHVTGSAGGGRDKDRRQILGELAGKNADIVIVTNEDPYDEDPLDIMEAVARGAESAGKIRQKDLFIITSRGKAIQQAVNLAQNGDLVLITGKGSEQAIVVENNKKIMWDDREKARMAIKNRRQNDFMEKQ